MSRLAAPLIAAACALVSACSPRFDWREVRSADDGFVVALPDRPQQVTRELDYPAAPGASGAPGAQHTAPGRVTMAMLSTGVGPTMFAVGAARLPRELLADPRQADAAVAWLRDGLARNVGSNGLRATVIPADRLPRGPVRRVHAGVEVRAAGAIPASAPAKAGAPGRAAHLAARIYVADDRLYQLVVLGAEGEVPPDAIETFFASFRLLD